MSLYKLVSDVFGIPGVNALNASGVRDGVSVSGIQEYEVFLDLIVEGLKSNVGSISFKIWNFPGMSVSYDNPVHEVKDDLELANLNLNDANVKYVLVNDITVNNHTPIGTSGNSFTGTFYGAGHTVSIGGFTVPSGGAADIGLFGVVDGGYIRDLTVQHSGSVNRSGETRFGGIAGTMKGTAKMENVLVKGNVSVTVDTDHDLYTGGIAGLMLDVAEINNAYGGLDLTVKHPTASIYYGEASSVMVGGITGSIGIHWDVDNDDIIYEGMYSSAKIFNATVEGNINVDAAVEDVSFDETQTGLLVGGIVGTMIAQSLDSPAVLNNSCYRRGKINVMSESGSAIIGGVIGRVDYGKIQNCYAFADKFEARKTSGYQFSIGGFVGLLYNGEVKNCYSENPINIESPDDAEAGGFGGTILAETTYCYAKGSVTVICKSGSAGGFAGSVNNIKYCYASGDVKLTGINIINSPYYVGGFTARSSGYVEDCYALGNVDASGYEGKVGGLIGEINGSVNRCFSTGTVNNRGTFNTYWGHPTGGLFGSLNNNFYIIQNNVALCKSVTKISPQNPNSYIGRVYGQGSSTIKNNYAYSGMLVNGSTVSSGTHINKDGKDISLDDFLFQDFWRNAPPASGAPTATSGLGFKSEDWIFDTVKFYGHPILRASKNGPAMGGQLIQ